GLIAAGEPVATVSARSGALGVVVRRIMLWRRALALPPQHARANGALIQHRAYAAVVATGCGCTSTGSVPVKMAPPVGPLGALSSPPCARRMRRAMASPRPAPPVCRLRDASPR